MQVVLLTDIADTPGYGKYAGTYKLATEIRKSGFSCQIIDNYTWYSLDKLKLLIKKFITHNTLVLGISCTLNEKRIDGKVLHWGIPDHQLEDLILFAKNLNPNIKVLAGGSRITAYSNWEYIDYTVVNKGDIAIIKILNHLKNNEPLISKRINNTVMVNGDDYFYSQDEFNKSFIEYQSNDIILPNESIPVEIARGCIFSCAYCHFDLIGKRIGDWTKHPSILTNEFIRNYELFGTTHYMFSDELINESVDKLKMLQQVISKLSFQINYTAYARVDLIYRYPEMRELLLETGAVSLAFGIETFNQSAGKAVGKGLDVQKVKDTLHRCRELWKGKIIVSSNFIVGLPNETEQDVWDTVEYLVSDQSPLDLFGFLPLYIRAHEDSRSSSKMDKHPGKFGYILTNGKWQSNTMSFDRAQQLVSQIRNDSRVKRKTKFSAATWIGRILSLGYSVEEIYRMIHDDIDYDDEIFTRTSKLKQLYFDKLINL